jgi:hypothetical protein
LQNTIDSITRLVESSPNGDILIKDNKNIIDNINKAL